MDKHYLSPLLSPQSVLVFADSQSKYCTPLAQSQVLYKALTSQRFVGKLTFLDIRTKGTLEELAHVRADLAIVSLPHPEVAAALEVAGQMKCKAALVVSSGMGIEQAAELKAVALRSGMHLLGPNCLGFQRPYLGLNASVAGSLADEGSLALVSQSGALTSSILDWASCNNVGFSAVVSLGANTAVDIADVLDFLAADAKTQSIVICMEGIVSARRFMSALRAAANAKPVVVLKSGRKNAGNAAAQTHSGTIVGSDDVFDAALRRAGAVRVSSFVELFSAAKCLASRHRPVGKRLAIITNGGGPGVLAADWAIEIGLTVAHLSPEVVLALAPLLSPQATLSGLIDLAEDAGPEAYTAALQAAAKCPAVDGLLALYSPKPGGDATEVAQALAALKPNLQKPLLACWMGDASVAAARRALSVANVPNFQTPEAAVGAFGHIASFYENRQLLQQIPPPLSALVQPDLEGARLLIEGVLADRRKVLTEMESKALLSTFHIPVTQTLQARTATEAMMIATQLGYPVALKIDSPDISHKSDVNGVALGLMNAVAVRDTFNNISQSVKRLRPDARINGITVQRMAPTRRGRELCIGLVTDVPFGPVITFGAGGTMIELINDRAMELPPLNHFLAHRLINRARVADTLGEWRGASAVNVVALEQVLLRVSEMVCALPQLREMDINPIIVDEHGAIAVDARIVIEQELGSAREYGHLAILPYPAHHEQVWPLRGGGQYTLRPIRPDDAQMLQELVKSLSPESRYFRFVSSLTELPSGMLSRFTLIDYDREMALVAIHQTREAGPSGEIVTTDRIVGVSRYVVNVDGKSCEFALVVADDFGCKGLGMRLMLSIMDVAREKGLSAIEGLVLVNNPGMLRLMKSLGFQVKPFAEDPDFRLVSHRL